MTWTRPGDEVGEVAKMPLAILPALRKEGLQLNAETPGVPKT